MITLSTGNLFPYGLNRIFKIAEDSGVDGLELIARPMNFGEHKDTAFWDSWDVNYLRELQDTHGINIITLHTQPNFEENPYSHWERTAKLASDLGVEYVICHIPYLHETTYQQWFTETYLGKKPFDFTILAENVLHGVGKKKMVYETPQWQSFPNLCFDINHAMASHQNVKEILEQTETIREFHISNFDGEREHQNILHNKEFFKEVFSLKKVEIYCIEMYYSAFLNYQDTSKVVEELTAIKEFIEASQN